MDKYYDLCKIAADFRNGIELAQNAGGFVYDALFRDYPRACCGDASILLGHHLLTRGIKLLHLISRNEDKLLAKQLSEHGKGNAAACPE